MVFFFVTNYFYVNKITVALNVKIILPCACNKVHYHAIFI